MKPFDLAKALVAHPVVTKDGKYRVEDMHLFGDSNTTHPLVVKFTDGAIRFYTKRGEYYDKGVNSSMDLCMATKEVTYHINVRRGGTGIYVTQPTASEELADRNRDGYPKDFIKRLTFTIEE